MTGREFRLATVGETDIYIDSSWFVVFAASVWLLAVMFFPEERPNWPAWLHWAAGTVTALLFFVSVILHELGHAVVAQLVGIPVPRITLFLLGGQTRVSGEPADPKAELLISLGGPVATLVVALGLAAPLVLAPGALSDVLPALEYLALINVLLLVFNMIPALPLDGGRVLRAIIWAATSDERKGTRWSAGVGQGLAVVLVLVGAAFLIYLRDYNGLWWILTGWFVNYGAQGIDQQVALKDLLARPDRLNLLRRRYPAVRPDLTIEELMQHYGRTKLQPAYPVTYNGSLLGIVYLRDIRAVPRSTWRTVTLGQTMTPLSGPPDVEREKAA